MIRRTFALAAMTVAVLVPASPAMAHTNEVESVPAAGSRLQAPPDRVTISFDEPLIDAGTALVVTGADGTVISADDVTVTRNEVSATVTTKAPAGEYSVAYRIVSQDGHAVTGTFTYDVVNGGVPTQSPPSPADALANEAAATASLAAGASTGQDGGGVAGLVVIGIAVIVGVGVIAAVVTQGARRRAS